MKRSKLIWSSVMLVVLLADHIAVAQHEGHKMPPPSKAIPQASPTPSPATGEMPGMPGMATPASPNENPGKQTETNASPIEMDMNMGTGGLLVAEHGRMFVRLGKSNRNFLAMGQMGSGTSWLPVSTEMNMMHKQAGNWLLMFHYNLEAGVNSQGGPRGVTKAESANWFMPAAFRRVGSGTLQLRGMFSLEPFTFPPGGTPLLFQTGETYKGLPLIDRQHPHDLFMELSATYTVPIGERANWFAYFGYPGEPALGPPAFMHRPSASENSSAPLGHHLQDSSHISFGVFTTGIAYRWLKLEGSIFNGREPDENRYNFEAHPWNSRSIRFSVAPHDNWSIQVSHALLRNPEALEPGDVRRTTASIAYNKSFTNGSWSSSLIWGRNHESHGGEIFKLNGYLAESTLNWRDRNYVYTRLELVDKNQLLDAEDRLKLGISEDHPKFRIGAYTFGADREVWNTKLTSLAIGGDFTFYSKPSTLDPIYGNHPVSWKIFFRIRPAKMKVHSMH